jgi:hypothetical protein
MDDHSAQQSRANVARNAGIVSLAVMASRVLGLVRDQIFAGLFGAGLQYDAFSPRSAPNLARPACGAPCRQRSSRRSPKPCNKGKEEALHVKSRHALIVAVITAISIRGFSPRSFDCSRQAFAVPGKASSRSNSPGHDAISLADRPAAQAMGISCVQYLRYTGVGLAFQHQLYRRRLAAGLSPARPSAGPIGGMACGV